MQVTGIGRLAVALLLALAPPLAEAARDIAVLLPQSGRMSRAADAIRDGLLAAYYQDSGAASDSPVLHFYDSDGTPPVELLHQARAAGADFIIGPLDRERVDALVKAAPLPLPVLALNVVSGDAADVAGFALAPEDEIQRLVEWMTQQGVRRPLLLVAPDEASQRQLHLLQAAWQQSHPAAPAVFTLDAARKGGIAAAIKELLARQGAATDALVLATPALAQQVRPALAYYRSSLPLYSLAAAWEPGGDASALYDLEGMRFCDQPWMLEAARPEQEALYAALPRPGSSYDRLYAFGADAWTLARSWQALQAGASLPLRTGLLRLEDGHTLHRQPTCAEVRNGTALPLWSPALPDSHDGSGR